MKTQAALAKKHQQIAGVGARQFDATAKKVKFSIKKHTFCL
jgi:hypothetical protein